MSFNLTTTYALEQCCVCGIGFGIPQEFQQELVRSHNTFFCPNGHKQSYRGETEAQKLKKRLEREQEAHARTRSNVHAADRRTAREKRSHAATKGKLTKTTNRIKNGVCPFCNRSFTNLKAHMDTKHGAEECHA